jgi:hypothetical protein
MGGGIFINTIVLGSVLLVTEPSQLAVDKTPFLRDLFMCVRAGRERGASEASEASASEASATKRCPSAGRERSERNQEVTFCGRSGLRWGHERSERNQEVSFFGESGLRWEHERSERNQEVSFCGKSGLCWGLEGARATGGGVLLRQKRVTWRQSGGDPPNPPRGGYFAHALALGCTRARLHTGAPS